MAEHPIPNKVWLCWEAQEDGTGAVAAVAVPGVVDLPPPRQRGNVCKAARGRPPAGICVPLPVMCKRLILRRGGGTGMGNRRTHGDTGHRRLRAIPKSTSRSAKEAMIHNMIPHVKKPDLSNLVKFAEDMLKGIVLIDDNLVTKIIAMKCYSVEPKTVMTISPYGG